MAKNDEIKEMLNELAPKSSRNMLLNLVASSLGHAAENATTMQQQLQTIAVANTALSSSLIHSMAAKGES